MTRILPGQCPGLPGSGTTYDYEPHCLSMCIITPCNQPGSPFIGIKQVCQPSHEMKHTMHPQCLLKNRPQYLHKSINQLSEHFKGRHGYHYHAFEPSKQECMIKKSVTTLATLESVNHLLYCSKSVHIKLPILINCNFLTTVQTKWSTLQTKECS